MQEIHRNENVLKLIAESYIIHDASIIKIDIHKLDNILRIDIYLQSIAAKDVAQIKFKLSFINVLEYNFYWNAKFTFYTVESYKLLKSDKGYYLSLDPANNLKGISVDDQDFILSSEIEGSII